jgi:Pyruvate:ferredoxin oxidoreductase and related 2-oxoacid:ferredoxin oxidoreductases, beta subunit
MSKSTPLGAVAKFAASGKRGMKKDIALQAIAYGNIYVGRIAYGADPQQALQAIREAEAYEGASIIIAYSHCIAHGIDMERGLNQQQLAVKSGHWPLYRFNPKLREAGKNPFTLDTLRPNIPLWDYRKNETRFVSLQRSNPDVAQRLLDEAQQVTNFKWKQLEELAAQAEDQFVPMVGG